MAKFITRTITSSQIVIGELLEGEVSPIGTITEEGKLDQEKALKVVRKAFPTRNVLVLDVIQDEAQYKISVEDFIAHAEKVETIEDSTEVEVSEDKIENEVA